jgi:hypothetical protein
VSSLLVWDPLKSKYTSYVAILARPVRNRWDDGIQMDATLHDVYGSHCQTISQFKAVIIFMIDHPKTWICYRTCWCRCSLFVLSWQRRLLSRMVSNGFPCLLRICLGRRAKLSVANTSTILYYAVYSFFRVLLFCSTRAPTSHSSLNLKPPFFPYKILAHPF